MAGSGGNSYTTNYNTTHTSAGTQNAGKNENYTKNNSDTGGSANSYHKPRGVLDAVSEIQQYYVLEKQTEDSLPVDYFTYKQVIDFFNIGLKSAFIESLLFIMIIPFAEALYPSFKLFFYGEELSFNEQFFIYAAAYAPVIVMTIFLAAMAKYYSGKITKKALISLISGRSMAFTLKGIIVFFLWVVISTALLSDPSSVYWIADHSLFIFQFFIQEFTITPEHVYYYIYNGAIPAMNQTAINVLVTMLILSILPFVTLFYRGWKKDRKAMLARRAYDEY